MLRVLLRVVFDAVFVGIVLFGAAGTLAWPRGWVLLGVLLVVRLLSAIAVYRVNPTLLRERVTVLMHREQPVADKLVLLAHPMYAGNPLVNLGLSLWLGSYTAVLCASLPLLLLMVRIGLEERFLRRELPGYPEYMKRVSYRLLPGIW